MDELMINYSIPKEVKESAERLGIKVSQGPYGPIFSGETERVNNLVDLYMSLTTISNESLSSDTIEENINQIATSGFSNVNEIMQDQLSNKVSLRPIDRMRGKKIDEQIRDKEKEEQVEELEEREREKRHKSISQKNKEKIAVAIFTGGTLAPETFKMAEELGLNPVKTSSRDLQIVSCEKEELLGELSSYNSRVTSNDIFTQETARGDYNYTVEKLKKDYNIYDANYAENINDKIARNKERKDQELDEIARKEEFSPVETAMEIGERAFFGV